MNSQLQTSSLKSRAPEKHGKYCCGEENSHVIPRMHNALRIIPAKFRWKHSSESVHFGDEQILQQRYRWTQLFVVTRCD